MIRLLPTPKSCQTFGDEHISLAVAVCTDHKDFAPCQATLADFFAHAFEAALATDTAGGIELRFDAALAPDAYVIDTQNGCLVYASAPEGLCYAFASLLQLIEADGRGITVPKVRIEDRPDKPYRSLMVDLARCWHPFWQVLRFVDVCFLYKITYLHLHFADDQRYTLPSAAFPKLNKAGETYTAEQLAYLNDYAAARGVRLVPEIECPGHAAILNEHYPEVFGIRQDSEGEALYTELGVRVDHRSLINAGNERAFEGVKTLFREVCELFPNSQYIHIGGDEAAIKLWNTCADTRAYMKEKGITDVYELYSEYVGRVTDYILSLGRTPMVWEGFPVLGSERIDRRTVVIAWESHYQLAPELLKAGFQIINASWQPLYLVPSLTRRWDFRDILAWDVYNWQHWWEHSAATEHPINVAPTEQVMGSILCSWEMTYEQEMGRLMENLMAMSERVWTVERRRSEAEYKAAFSHCYGVVSRILMAGSGRAI
ncbi:MAG: hypothetical protein E7585_07000 [Ruminococcaceae bacterium]|nr:hypothetical protein [Oscillospiraceae bacterium]